MKQLNVFCEGQTEQGFCAQVLQPHLFPQGDGVVYALAVGEKNNRHVFGIGRASKFERVRKFILNTVRQRAGRNVHFTTLFDLYALPISFPGAEVNVRNAANPHLYADALEEAFKVDIACHHFIQGQLLLNG